MSENKRFSLMRKVIMLVLSVISAFCFFFAFSEYKKTIVNADTDISFRMRDGVSLAYLSGVNNGSSPMKLGFYVPDFIMSKYSSGSEFINDAYGNSVKHHYAFFVYRVSNVEEYYGSGFSFIVDDFLMSFSSGLSSGAGVQVYSIESFDGPFTSDSLLTCVNQNNGTWYCEVGYDFPPDNVLIDGTEIRGVSYDYTYFVDFVEYVPSYKRIERREIGLLGTMPVIVEVPSELNTLNRTGNYVQTSISHTAAGVLSNADETWSESEISYFQDLAGIHPWRDTISVDLHYKKCIGFNQYEEVVERYAVKSLYKDSPKLIASSIFNNKGVSNLHDFDCVFENVSYVEEVGGVVSELLTDSKILLVANGWRYEQGFWFKRDLYIVYKDYDYSDFAIQVKDNDLTDGIDLTFYAYTTNVTTDGMRRTLTFDFSTIQTMVYNSVHWLCDIDQDNVTIVGRSRYIDYTLTDDRLEIVYDISHENDLSELCIFFLAEIIPDYECTMTLEYVSLDENLHETTMRQTSTMMYSEYVRLGYGANLYSHYSSIIDDAIHPDVLNGLEYYHFSDIECIRVSDNKFRVKVLYTYSTIFKLTNSLNDEVVYQGLTKNSLTYTGRDFDFNVPSGYRISSLTTTDKRAVTITSYEENFNQTTVVVNCQINEKKVIPLHATYIDKWHVNFVYLDRYKDTCFAVKKVEKKDVRIADYDSIYSFDINDVKTILGFESMDILKSQPDDEVLVEYNGHSTYTVTVSYSFATIRLIEAYGGNEELIVPLTCYSDWCNSIGKDWSILYLNNSEHTYFKYSNEVARENLYGYFAVCVYHEQLRDINSWFANESGEGAVVLSVAEEMRGSGFYKFLREPIPILGNVANAIGGPLGLGVLALCEIADDNNAKYFSYFIYLDCSVSQAYLSRSGATDAFDRDGALKNTAEAAASAIGDRFSGIGNYFKGLSDDVSNFFRIVLILLGVAGLVLVAAFVYRLICLFKDRKKNVKPDSSSSKSTDSQYNDGK